MRSIFKCAVSLLLTVTVQSAWAGNFTVGVEAIDYLPIYKGEGSQYSGFSRELLDAFAAKYGHQFSYKAFPVARLFDEFIKGGLDFKFPDNPQWSSDAKKGKNISYSKGAVEVVEGLMVLPENKGKGIATIRKLATMRGFTAWPYLDAINKKTIELTESNSFEALIQMGINKRADGIYISTIVGNFYLNEVMKKQGALVLDSSLPNTQSSFSLSSQNHPEVIAQFNEFLGKEKAAIAKLKAKYKIEE
ncbi:substrate-binding periplasmic protein [Parachitinimonas caeni]|uniref:Transporter substrate-binding domain-containing protein n=1 Tax=Parachitinimonas caeni TaxID=3031301 RepID=A0ABT7E423_9NEIS|nr:transporter substrate-binding domain-containing protein [Parachitinimonas caeni]MDK2126083.1 transporter substrate-binding domain-containing protein [Parachitinimonas caeni]